MLNFMTYLGPEPIYRVMCLNIIKCLNFHEACFGTQPICFISARYALEFIIWGCWQGKRVHPFSVPFVIAEDFFGEEAEKI